MRSRAWWIVAGSVSLVIASVGIAYTTRTPHVSTSMTTLETVERVKSPGIPPDGLEFERKLVRDAPFSATQVIETTALQSDGNSSTKTSTSIIYRDKAGRTRRDVFAEKSVGAESPTLSIINDPVSGFTYTLYHISHLARRGVFVGERNQPGSKQTDQAATSTSVLPVPLAAGAKNSGFGGGASEKPSAKEDALGTREIEQVLAEGTRMTMTVRAKTVGNEEAFDVVMERWYSPDLKANVLIRRTNPRNGDSTYRLTNINRNEPAAALFSIPSEYKIQP